MAAGNPVVNLIVQGAKARGLDPAAVLAVASQEGLSGRIGDGGHAYGPFQLNNAGGVITGSHPAVNDAATQAWASSPAGINFALDRIASVARGLHGQQAVNAIVTRFERPANPGREVAGANAAYGSYTNTGSAPTVPSPAPLAGPQQPVQRPTIGSNDLALLNAGNRMFGLAPIPQIPSSAPLRLPKAAAAVTSSPTQQPPTLPAYKAPNVKGTTTRYIEHLAAPFGLTVTATTNGTHAKNSYHYQGRAVDFGGAPARMASLAKFALQNANQFSEFIYTGPGNPGYSILGGKVIPNSQLDPHLYQQHLNHVHLAR